MDMCLEENHQDARNGKLAKIVESDSVSRQETSLER